MDSVDPMDAALRVSRERSGSTCVLRVTGEVDVATSPLLRREATLDEDALQVLILDCTGVTFLDSAGLTVLVQVDQWCRERAAELRIITRTRAVLRALQITGLDRVLTIAATLDDARPA
ncbi:anti-sigma factor antagonist [Amycolatopsis sp. PS_44_ISF1]|uniref:anti-sigma factor antagonist n=1 Tax=Amycolatopsis sp. PS_44_ISF1 TaxID=2974917 RepID=UPI0028DE98EF|nr:anti-sigma factor antagonist [Amycolatopsis sp. PS_44_ISF1]MDT8913341.1 anti-sigma factor antagonist [Amycolatopsis sp. PS_44_ISF1]